MGTDDLKERLRANALDERNEAIALIEALEAERDALVAAAYDVAAKAVESIHAYTASPSARLGIAATKDEAIDRIRALTPDDARATLDRMIANAVEAETASLRTAAQAVLDRWDSPRWKDAGPTADVMADLRKALEGDT